MMIGVGCEQFLIESLRWIMCLKFCHNESLLPFQEMPRARNTRCCWTTDSANSFAVDNFTILHFRNHLLLVSMCFIVKFLGVTLCWCVWEYSTLLQVMSWYLRYSQTGYQLLPHLIKGHCVFRLLQTAGETAARWRRARGRRSCWPWAWPSPWPAPSPTTIYRTSTLNLRARACRSLQLWMLASWNWVSKIGNKYI